MKEEAIFYVKLAWREQYCGVYSLDKDGVGLGLYLVKSIINSHDEDIAVKSEDGVTEFVFTLALAQD